MKQYPSISREIQSGMHVYVFAKYDGSNIRVEWSKKRGFYKFGSRKRLLGTDQGLLTRAENLIRAMEHEVGVICADNRWQQGVFFYEFFGPSSFAGNHEPSEEQEVRLIDMAPHKQGILPPKEFHKIFSHRVSCAELLASCQCNEKLVQDVREGLLPGMPFEGVVCKAMHGRHNRVMFKIKSQAWLDRLREKVGNDDRLFEMLR